VPVFPVSLTDLPVAGLTLNNQIYIDGNDGGNGYALQSGAWVPTFAFTGFPIYGSIVIKAPFPDNNSISLLALGGLGGDQLPTDRWIILTPVGWHDVQPALPQPFYEHCAILYNSTTFLVIGGSQAGRVPSSDVFVFNSLTMTWTRAANLFFGRINPYCAMIRSSAQSQVMIPLVMLGNFDTTDKLKSTEYSTDLSSWMIGPQFSYPIRNPGVANDNKGGIILVGGYSGYGFFDKILYLEHVQSDWIYTSFKLKVAKSSMTVIPLPDGAVNCG
jgi:hypothetical protein